jgi:hypothetical protein
VVGESQPGARHSLGISSQALKSCRGPLGDRDRKIIYGKVEARVCRKPALLSSLPPQCRTLILKRRGSAAREDEVSVPAKSRWRIRTQPRYVETSRRSPHVARHSWWGRVRGRDRAMVAVIHSRSPRRIVSTGITIVGVVVELGSKHELAVIVDDVHAFNVSPRIIKHFFGISSATEVYPVAALVDSAIKSSNNATLENSHTAYK